ncbi:hypothetical protein [Halosolutus gelatinilyticus]|uniref:hypothetical protein n=1 Tax=Halosolutus gelatinilyticus TaxID=2931975 RepID=UPI001FF34EA2|nr:hypothetical protein [Halosolutus gelatinilyticus]
MSRRSRVVAIARTELRRRWRTVRNQPVQLLALAIAGLFFVPIAIAGLVGAFLFGSAIADGSLGSPLRWTRSVVIYAWLFAAAFSGFRAYNTASRPDCLDGLLTTVSHRDLLGGLVLAELLLWGLPAAAYALALAAAFAVGGQLPLAAPVAALALVAPLVTGLLTGYGLVLCVRTVGARSRRLARLRTVFLAALGLAYFGILVTQNVAAIVEPLVWLLEPTPIGWYADLALVGTADEASIGRAAAAVVASAAFLLASGPVLARLAASLWYADGVAHDRTDRNEGWASAAAAIATSRLAAIFPRSAVGVATVDWKRARRKPIALSFVMYPFVLLVVPTMNVVQSGTVGSSFPLWIVLCGAWISGTLFTLNVVGNEGAALPVTVLSANAGRALVAGHAIAGALVVTPITVAATVGFGLISPHSAPAVATLSASAVVLTVCAGPIATGVGAAVPRFEAVSVSRRTKAIVPSVTAFAVYSATIAIVAAPTLVAHSSIVGHAIASLLGTSRLVVALIGVVGTTVLSVCAGLLSARYAIRTVETYRFE